MHKPDKLRRHPLAEYWRLSFSFPEQTLSHSITDNIRYAYLVAKFLLKFRFEKRQKNKFQSDIRPGRKQKEVVFRSYMLKTTLYWFMCNRNSHRSCVANELFFLLQHLLGFYVKRHLPHFFLPEVNLLEQTEEGEIDAVVKEVRLMLSDLEGCVINTLKAVRVVDYR